MHKFVFSLVKSVILPLLARRMVLAEWSSRNAVAIVTAHHGPGYVDGIFPALPTRRVASWTTHPPAGTNFGETLHAPIAALWQPAA